jgi:hypothetical protein
MCAVGWNTGMSESGTADEGHPKFSSGGAGDTCSPAPPGCVTLIVVSPSRSWRVEADDEWHAEHRSAFFKRRRSKLFDAVSHAELGPFGGAPRRPTLKLTDKDYSHVRYAERHFSYTAIQIDLLECRVCGHRMLEQHRLLMRAADGSEFAIGHVRKCRRCHKESWLFTSHMPATVAARRRDAKVVL